MNIDVSSLWQWIQEQVRLATLYLERPAVQRQVGAIIVVLAVTWLAPKLLDLLLVRLERSLHKQRQRAGASGNVASAARQDAPGTADDDGGSSTVAPPSQPESWQERGVRLIRAVNFVLFPVLALLIFQVLLGYFAEQGWPSGLMQSVLPILWLVLGYRLIFSLMLTFLPAGQAERGHSHYLRPIVFLLVLVILSDILFNTLGLGDFVVVAVQEFSITLGGIFSALQILLISYILSWLTYHAVYNVLERNKAEPGLLETVSKVARYAVLGLGGVVTLGVLGVDLGTLGWITTGLSVGIGFGLQELFANFASGIVLTFERSVRPGDVIESQGTRGVVSQVGMRATVIRTADRAEVFVPNKELMTKPLIALTYSDRVARVALNVSVAYGSDIDKVNEVLLATVTRHPLILANPEPGAFVTELAAYSINFLVFGFVADFNDAFRVRAELYQMVRDALVQQGIDIPFPRSDMYIVQETQASSDRAT